MSATRRFAGAEPGPSSGIRGACADGSAQRLGEIIREFHPARPGQRRSRSERGIAPPSELARGSSNLATRGSPKRSRNRTECCVVEFVKRKAPVYIRYTFDPVERATWVIRALDLTIQMPGILKVAEPLVVSAFRKENVRMLAELKRYVEAQSKQRDLVCP